MKTVVDKRRMELVSRISALGESSGAPPMFFYVLGMSFSSAWLSASDVRTGGVISPFDLKELQFVNQILESLGWLDLMDQL